MLKNIIAQISFPSSGLFLVLVLAGVLGWRWWKQKNTYKSLASVPSPKKHWLLGNIPQVLAAVKQKKFFRLLFDWSQEFGPIYVYWIDSPILVLSRPKAIEDTIINGMRDGSLVRTYRAQKVWNDISGPILLGQDGTEWQWRRKAWNPEFSSSGLSKYIGVIKVGCSQVIETITEAKPSEVVKVDPLFVELTMRVISCLMLGIPVDQKISTPEGVGNKLLIFYLNRSKNNKTC